MRSDEIEKWKKNKIAIAIILQFNPSQKQPAASPTINGPYDSILNVVSMKLEEGFLLDRLNLLKNFVEKLLLGME